MVSQSLLIEVDPGELLMISMWVLSKTALRRHTQQNPKMTFYLFVVALCQQRSTLVQLQ